MEKEKKRKKANDMDTHDCEEEKQENFKRLYSTLTD